MLISLIIGLLVGFVLGVKLESHVMVVIAELKALFTSSVPPTPPAV